MFSKEFFYFSPSFCLFFLSFFLFSLSFKSFRAIFFFLPRLSSSSTGRAVEVPERLLANRYAIPDRFKKRAIFVCVCFFFFFLYIYIFARLHVTSVRRLYLSISLSLSLSLNSSPIPGSCGRYRFYVVRPRMFLRHQPNISRFIPTPNGQTQSSLRFGFARVPNTVFRGRERTRE